MKAGLESDKLWLNMIMECKKKKRQEKLTLKALCRLDGEISK